MKSPVTCRREFTTGSVEETLALAAELGGLLEGGEVVALLGDLGSGKTTFTKGLCAGLGLGDTRQVASPTYVLEHVYPARLPVRHYDVYRLRGEAEFLDLGFDEHLGGRSVLVIEWADKVASLLPPDHLRVDLAWPRGSTSGEAGPARESRRIVFTGPAIAWEEKLRRLDGTASRSLD